MPIDLTRLATARLALRPVAAADIGFVAELFARPELTAHRPDPRPDSHAAVVARLEADGVHWARHGFGRWLLTAEDHPVGLGGLTVKDGFDGLNLSYHLHPDHWGKGYATEFARAALEVAFGPLRAPRVVGLVRPANPASRAVLERLGFRYERSLPLQGAPTDLFALDAPG
ncbi:GNAT family N-acetyltransferase [Acidimangrovimonas pyrenivorans]|uniref:GNAT family N-acetyltransferase n=1 Tax=Acidimangrovimonas pyrenivorans TaxID=2030798 RepID=A0ABV7AJB7_9RHOB